ncbi:hypothetical protein [Streptomyces sp. NPDC047453]|uniref:hypothetical protein n=1 Tax=Streptomyces sp. NPDC047453 TaxID=3154812 RepID=UPI0033F566C3
MASVLGRNDIAVGLAGRAGDGLTAALARRWRVGRLHRAWAFVPGTGRSWCLLAPSGRLTRFLTLPETLFFAVQSAPLACSA